MPPAAGTTGLAAWAAPTGVPPVGAAGVTGPVGASGPAGLSGPTGPVGAAGPLGLMGPAGRTGPDGAAGPPVATVAGAGPPNFPPDAARSWARASSTGRANRPSDAAISVAAGRAATARP